MNRKILFYTLWQLFLFMPVFSFADSDTLIFTDAQKRWLDEHPVITLAVDNNNPPMNYLDQGKMTGISIDHMKLIAQRLGVEIRYFGSDWNTAFEAAIKHQVDGIINASIKEERKAYLNFTLPYFFTPDALISPIDSPSYSSPDSLNQKRVGVIRGSIRKDLYQEFSPECIIYEFQRLEDGITALSEGTIDVFGDELPILQNLIQRYSLVNIKINTVLFMENQGSAHVGLRNDDPMLVSLFDKAIESITKEEQAQIRDSYLQLETALSSVFSGVLTARERDFLQTINTLRIGVDAQFAPIEYKNPDGEYTGLSLDYLKIILDNLQVGYEIIPEPEWSRLIDLARNKELDIFSAVAPTEVRKEYLNFTENYISIPIMLYSKAGEQFIQSLNDLKGSVLVSVAGYAVTDLMIKDYPNLKIVTVNTIEEGLEFLSGGYADYFVGDVATTSYYIRKEALEDIQLIGQSEYSLDLAFGVRKDWSVLVDIINKELRKIPDLDRNIIYQKWMPLGIQTQVDYQMVFSITGIFLILILLVLLWNKSLKKEVAAKNKAMEELQQTQQMLIASEKMASMGTLIAGIAHELNNPLNFISSGMDALEILMEESCRTDLDEEKKEQIQQVLLNIRTGITRSAEIISSLREYSNSDEDSIVRFSVHGTIELALDLLLNEWKEKISVFKEWGDLPKIKGNPGKISQVFVNLLKNSIDSILQLPEGASKQFVKIRTELIKDGGSVRILIQDSGAGIPVDYGHRVFDPFFTTKESGVGLGLSVSKKIVESHGGTIELIKENSAKTTFEVILPIEGMN